MEAQVQRRLRGDGRIWVDRVKTKVLRDTGGWYAVLSPSGLEDARVLYRRLQDMLVVEQSGRFLKIAFKDGEGAFSWKERVYRIGSMVLGEIRIDEGSRSVARGVVTRAGIRLSEFEPELVPIVRALSWGLTLRSEEISRDASFRPPG